MNKEKICIALDRLNLDTLINLLIERTRTIEAAYDFVSDENEHLRESKTKLTEEIENLKVELSIYEEGMEDDRK